MDIKYLNCERKNIKQIYLNHKWGANLYNLSGSERIGEYCHEGVVIQAIFQVLYSRYQMQFNIIARTKNFRKDLTPLRRIHSAYFGKIWFERNSNDNDARDSSIEDQYKWTKSIWCQ